MAKVKLVEKKAGRPPGTANKKSQFLRDRTFKQMRCTEGFDKTIDELVSTGLYKSKADVMHEALQILAYRRLPGTFYWLDKIQ